MKYFDLKHFTKEYEFDLKDYLVFAPHTEKYNG